MASLQNEIIRKVAELGELEESEVTEDRPLKDLGIDMSCAGAGRLLASELSRSLGYGEPAWRE